MISIRFNIERGPIGGATDVMLVEEGEDPREALTIAVLEDIATEVYVTVGGTTMFLAAWQAPEHWEQEWADELGVDQDDVMDAVAALFGSAVEG